MEYSYYIPYKEDKIDILNIYKYYILSKYYQVLFEECDDLIDLLILNQKYNLILKYNNNRFTDKIVLNFTEFTEIFSLLEFFSNEIVSKFYKKKKPLILICTFMITVLCTQYFIGLFTYIIIMFIILMPFIVDLLIY